MMPYFFHYEVQKEPPPHSRPQPSALALLFYGLGRVLTILQLAMAGKPFAASRQATKKKLFTNDDWKSLIQENSHKMFLQR